VPAQSLAQGVLGRVRSPQRIEFNALIEEMRAGTAYVNFHTTAYPSGEIRGQVRLLN
jgi:hypothetical protein